MNALNAKTCDPSAWPPKLYYALTGDGHDPDTVRDPAYLCTLGEAHLKGTPGVGPAGLRFIKAYLAEHGLRLRP